MQVNQKLMVEVTLELPQELAAYLSEGLLGMKVQFYWRSPVQTQYLKSAHKQIQANLTADELNALMDVSKELYEH